jgi:hypothetical protein
VPGCGWGRRGPVQPGCVLLQGYVRWDGKVCAATLAPLSDAVQDRGLAARRKLEARRVLPSNSVSHAVRRLALHNITARLFFREGLRALSAPVQPVAYTDCRSDRSASVGGPDAPRNKVFIFRGGLPLVLAGVPDSGHGHRAGSCARYDDAGVTLSAQRCHRQPTPLRPPLPPPATNTHSKAGHVIATSDPRASIREPCP